MSDTPRMESVAGHARGIVDAGILAEGMKLERELHAANERIKRLEEDAGSNKLKAADDHIRALKIIISRASTAFFCDGSDGQVALRMLTILGEASKPMTCEDKESKP